MCTLSMILWRDFELINMHELRIRMFIDHLKRKEHDNFIDGNVINSRKISTILQLMTEWSTN